MGMQTYNRIIYVCCKFQRRVLQVSQIMVLCHHCSGRFLIFLVFWFLLCGVLAAPATRSLKSIKAYYSTQDATGVTQAWMMRSKEGFNVREGRMDVELSDYTDPGANPGHEPVTPPQG